MSITWLCPDVSQIGELIRIQSLRLGGLRVVRAGHRKVARMNSLSTHIQFARFAVVGLVSNIALFLCYLGLTELGVGHKVAMSTLYAVGVAQTFLVNKKWSFRHGGSGMRPFARYLATYGTGYAVNLSVLVVFVDRLGFPHLPVQGFTIVIVAVLLFLAQKHWVFTQVEVRPVGRKQ